jgi:hypothetical protein
MQTVKRSKGKHPVRALVFLTNPTVLLLAVIFFLFSWRIPTHVQIEFVVEQTTVLAEEAVASFQPGNGQTIVIPEGKISYPDYPDIPSVTFLSPEQIEFEAKGDFTIDEVLQKAEGKRVLRFHGIVTHLRSGTSDAFQDRRLTQFDRVRSTRWAMWIGVGVWLIATGIGWYRLYQELKG